MTTTARQQPVTLLTRCHTGPLWRRATAFIEFAFILPIFLFLIIFSIDMGHLILISGAFQNATYAGARGGAQTGTPGSTDNGDSHDSFMGAASAIPTVNTNNIKILEVSPATCSPGNDEVHVRTEYDTGLITPGLNAMLRLMGVNAAGSDGTYHLVQSAVARCEITH